MGLISALGKLFMDMQKSNPGKNKTNEPQMKLYGAYLEKFVKQARAQQDQQAKATQEKQAKVTALQEKINKYMGIGIDRINATTICLLILLL